MRKQNYLIGVMSLFVLQACGNQSETGTTDESVAAETVETDVADTSEVTEGAREMSQPNDCPVIASRDWQAWINAMPGPDAVRSLNVTGEIDLPTPGYEIEVIAGAADRSAIPTQRIILKATPPSGMVTQVVTPETVTYSGPVIAQQYRSIMVLCGDQMIAEITDIPVAQ
ncbi:hypothetical protein [Hyphococcus lacteus]|uniref:Lipoprotein n=1 Tax=Hyphococcus lacteus TaxID=3143536 RepID=A0ABV3Z7J6_9PROT